MSRVIETSKAIIKDNVQILKHIEKFTLPRSILDSNSTIEYGTFIKVTYRRFMRLQPLVSRRVMVRDTYTNYIRCKYRYEPVGLKRSLTLDESSISQSELKEQIYNSLQFIVQAVTYSENISSVTLRRDITLARQILKNLLTVEYEKLKGDSEKKWQYKENQPTNSNVIDFNIEFNHLKPFNSKLPKDKENKFVAIRSFDECLIYLNKTLKTIL